MIKIGGSYDWLERIREAKENLVYLNQLPVGGDAEFGECEFARPISIIPLALFGRDHAINFQNIPPYLETIQFPQGQEISGYTTSGDTYFPISRADLEGLEPNQQEIKLRNLSAKYSNLLRRNIEDEEFLNRIGKNVTHLIISESVDNIDQHARANTAIIFSQYYSANNSCEICLADNGIGIFQSLLRAGRDVVDDRDAMRKVIYDCLSAKDDGDMQNRGTGIRNMIRLLSNRELNGFFCVISGDAGYFVDSSNREHFLHLQNISWSGTIIKGI